MNSQMKATLVGVLTFVLAVIAAVSGYMFPHVPLVWQVALVLTVAFGVYDLFLQREVLKEAFAKKTTRYGLNALLMCVIALGVVVFLNMIANNYDVKKDITKNKRHTLSSQTLKSLQSLTEEVTVRAFVTPDSQSSFDKLFDQYKDHTDKLKVVFVDPYKDPLAVKTYQIKQQGTLLFESQSRTYRLEDLMGVDDPKAEEKMTNAILQVSKGSKKVVYFTVGHGEKSTSDTGRDGYSYVKQLLQQGRFDVKELTLLETKTMPEDAELVVMAGPKKSFMPHELTLLENYLADGGALLLMVEPDMSRDLKPLVTKLGIEWKQDYAIVETNPLLTGGNPLTPIVRDYQKSHEINKESGEITLFRVATPLESLSTIPQGVKVAPLFSTSSRSFVSKILDGKLKVDQKKDKAGPHQLAVAITGTFGDQTGETQSSDSEDKDNKKEMRVVMVGDADFPDNTFSQFGMNSDLFRNMLSWLSEEEDMISIAPKSQDGGKFNITPTRMRTITLASVFFLPITTLLSGLVIWWRRRRM